MTENRTPGEGAAPGDEKDPEAERRCLIDMIEYIQKQVERAGTLGVNLTEVESLLDGARIMIESGDLVDAAEIVGQCMQLASKRFSEHEVLARSIKKAEAEVQAAHGAGRDISDACMHLKLARECMEKGDYTLGIASAKNAMDALTKVSSEVVWGSGLLDDDK